MRTAGLLFALVITFGSPADAAPKKRIPSLAARVDRILSGAATASWGINVTDLKTGATVYARNPQQYFIPASNTKLFSTAFALNRLGPGYRFRTSITAPNKPDSSGRVSSLRLVGGGDPNLSGRVLPYQYKSEPGDPLQHIEQFAQQLVDAGVRLVDGDIVGDDSAYANEPYPEGWAVDDPLYDYGAPVSALFLNDGAFLLRAIPTITGEAPIVELSPPQAGILIHNQAVSGPGLDGLKFSRLPGSNELRMSGSVDSTATFKSAVDDPALQAATALREALVKKGVRVSGVARSEHFPAPGEALVNHESLPLTEVLTVINKESVNLHAEIVLLEASRSKTGQVTRAAAIDELAAFLKEIGIDAQEYTFEDGSGLSRKTLVTPRAVTTLLRFMYASPNRDAWVGTLPIGGVDGTLGTRFPNNPRARAIRAKTGSLSHVNALSGYAGDRYVFSIMVNNSNVSALVVRRAMDQIALELLR